MRELWPRQTSTCFFTTISTLTWSVFALIQLANRPDSFPVSNPPIYCVYTHVCVWTCAHSSSSMTASQRSCAGKIQTEPNANDEGLQHGDEYLAELDHIEASWLLSIVSLSEVLKWSFRSSASLASTSASQTLVHGAYYGKTLVGVEKVVEKVGVEKVALRSQGFSSALFSVWCLCRSRKIKKKLTTKTSRAVLIPYQRTTRPTMKRRSPGVKALRSSEKCCWHCSLFLKVLTCHEVARVYCASMPLP